MLSVLKIEQVDALGNHTPFPTPEQLPDLTDVPGNSFPPIPVFNRGDGYPGDWPTGEWVSDDPMAHGFSSTAGIVEEVFTNQSASNPTGLLIVKDGYLVLEEYRNGGARNERAGIATVSKSLVSMAMGRAMDDGLIDFQDEVEVYFPTWDAIRDSGMTIEMMMSMASGLSGTSPTQAKTVPEGVISYVQNTTLLDFPPGSHYYYHTNNVWLCSGIIETVSPPDTLSDYFYGKILEPLGVGPLDVVWATDNHEVGPKEPVYKPQCSGWRGRQTLAVLVHPAGYDPWGSYQDGRKRALPNQCE